jgi:hypothetical protein
VRVGHNPGGVAVAWAEENTRESLFAAFLRRETYATSGTRIVVRFYETWSPGDPCSDANFPAALVGKYQCFTEADLGRLRGVGCDHAFVDVAQGVGRYAAALRAAT